ncbi:hypothetical protein Poli38472_013575 [Pythium oligandrum]|uniref:Cystathionine gamma-synthase n=1 Tax=Pythium oligandrum TaxID=41045 RepID=A0A8K1FIU4_PYTOL|nr:hypothetical protein Poli38472_013575 [Pythium oligandrum]|eukprot:TMW61112.1 hypothetical protein Poli38472_013575 [Pythium oligandrum]
MTSYQNAAALLQAMPLPLGTSLPPNDPHAVSVSMPLWEHVVGYEEGRPEVMNALACGYPRFFRHPFVQKLQAHLQQTLDAYKEVSKTSTDDWELMVVPTEATAQRLRTFLVTQEDVSEASKANVSVHNVQNGLVWAVVFQKELLTAASRYWQHTGEILTSRHAEAVLKTLQSSDQATTLRLKNTDAHVALRQRIAGLYFDDATAAATASRQNVFVYPTGMGAIFAALRLLTHFDPKGKAILFGFPYLDSLKLLQRSQWCPNGVHFFPVGGDEQLKQVEEILKTEKVLAIFTEFPGNPLISVPDLERLAQLAHAHGTYLVVDDTVGSYNVNVLQHGTTDIVLTSLAKIFSGSCNLIAGSLVLNPQSAAFSKFSHHLLTTQDSFLFEDDAKALVQASHDLEPRLVAVNATANVIVERLSKHPLVKSIYYPSVADAAAIARYSHFVAPSRKSTKSQGYGPLFSVVFHGGNPVARAFYDNLHVAKGPSLGTNFTLACPYTQIAHFYELDHAEACGVDRNLVRISIGLEDTETLWQAVEVALKAATEAQSQN